MLVWFGRGKGKLPRVRCSWVVRPSIAVRVQPKPAWVLREVLRLKALMPSAGCRLIANVFNRRFAPKASVSKSFVAYSVRAHRYEIEVLRRQLKHRKPALQSRNQIWALDMTGKADAYGVSTAFRGALRLAGIRHQRTVPGCPWMNGRIERLFGTLKDKLRGIAPSNGAAFAQMLGEVSYWYNAVRPHQNLGGLTPLEAWHGSTRPKSRTDWPPWFEAWGGRLVGFDWQR